MLDSMLLLKKKYAPVITIPGWDGITYTKSAGVIVNPDSFEFSGGGDAKNVVDWIRIPYANTPNPVTETMKLTMRFIIFTAPAVRCDLISRFRVTANGFRALSVGTTGALNFFINSTAINTNLIMPFGSEVIMTIERTATSYQITINGSDPKTMNLSSPIPDVSIVDWVIGSFMNAGNGAPTSTITGGASTNSGSANWKLLELTIVRT